MSPQSAYGEDLILSMTVVANKTFKEVIKIKRGHKGGVLILRTGDLKR